VIGLKGTSYVFGIAFVASVGGFLFGYDLAIMGGANEYLKKQFELSDAGFGFTTASAALGCSVGPFRGAWLCDRLGRRRTLIGASFPLAIGAVLTALPRDIYTFNAFRIVGGVQYAQQQMREILLAIPHSFALGPLPRLMMSELYPTRIRARAVSITTTVLWITAFFPVQLFPILKGLSEQYLGSVAGVFWVYAAICVLSLIFGWTLLPETKGRSLEAIADSWKRVDDREKTT
jgi:MFS family permease